MAERVLRTGLATLLLACGALAVAGQQAPALVTAATRADPQALAALERPGRVVFEDGFETDASFDNYFEVRGRKEGLVVRDVLAGRAHRGGGANVRGVVAVVPDQPLVGVAFGCLLVEQLPERSCPTV